MSGRSRAPLPVACWQRRRGSFAGEMMQRRACRACAVRTCLLPALAAGVGSRRVRALALYEVEKPLEELKVVLEAAAGKAVGGNFLPGAPRQR